MRLRVPSLLSTNVPVMATERHPLRRRTVKIKFENTIRQFTYKFCKRHDRNDRSGPAWTPDLTFETFQFHIRRLFEFPSTALFMVAYTDEDDDLVTISNSDDLKQLIPPTHPDITLRMEVSMLTTESSSSDRIPHQIRDGGQINLPVTEHALTLKQLMTKLISNFELVKQQIRAYQTLSEERDPTTQIIGLVENLLQITTSSSELTSRLTFA